MKKQVGRSIRGPIDSGQNETEWNENVMFYAWECVSIVRNNFTTLDFVIKDHKDALALLNILHTKVFKPDR